MSRVTKIESQAAEIATDISALAEKHGYTVAVAESLTGGKMTNQFAAAPDSSEWFAGGLVCYKTRIKYEVLGVPEGPVITEAAVQAMARGITDLMGADAAVALSGSGGPGEQEGNPTGTTWIAVLVRGEMHTELHHFPGQPEDILAQSQYRAISLLHKYLKQQSGSPE